MAAMDKVAKEREDMANKEGKKRSAGDAPSKAAGKKKVKMPGVGRRLDDGEVVAVAPPAPAPAPRAWQFGKSWICECPAHLSRARCGTDVQSGASLGGWRAKPRKCEFGTSSGGCDNA